MTMLKTKEHYDLLYQFEKDLKVLETDKEPKELWCKGIIYCNGKVNELFRAYRTGYAFGKTIGE